MSSHTRPKMSAFDGAPIRDAVSAVAERSFFAIVDGCDDPGVTTAPFWLFAFVRFDDGRTSGSLACWLPPELAQMLFDSFSGRDPAGPTPPAHHVDDLVGEFSNMVCGDWLSRCHGQWAFQLSPPIVVRAPRPDLRSSRRLWVKVNDRPLAIDWDFTAGPEAAPGRR